MLQKAIFSFLCCCLCFQSFFFEVNVKNSFWYPVRNRHSSLVLLLLLKNQATSPANSLRLCNLRRLTSVFVVLVKFTDFE